MKWNLQWSSTWQTQVLPRLVISPDLGQQILWQDIHLGSASHSLSCNRVGKPQGLLAGCILSFSDIFISTTVLGSICEGALKPHFTDSCGSLGMCCACSLPPRPLETLKSWPDGALSWPLGSGSPWMMCWFDLIGSSVLATCSELNQLLKAWGAQELSLWSQQNKESWFHPLQVWPWGRFWPWRLWVLHQ